MSNLIFCDRNLPLPTLAGVRAWLMEGGNPDGDVEQPLWAQAMARLDPEAVAELLTAGANPNQRTPDGRGWLHWCADTQQPVWLALQPFSQLDATWWHPDHQGRTPFHIPTLPPLLGQSMGARWWGQRLPWSVLDQGRGDPEAVARQAGADPLARVWQGWARACS